MPEKHAAMIATIEIALYDLLEGWSEEPILKLEAALFLFHEPVEIAI